MGYLVIRCPSPMAPKCMFDWSLDKHEIVPEICQCLTDTRALRYSTTSREVSQSLGLPQPDSAGHIQECFEHGMHIWSSEGRIWVEGKCWRERGCQMGNVSLIKACRSEALRTDKKFWEVEFRDIPNKEITGLYWYKRTRKHRICWWTWIYVFLKAASTAKESKSSWSLTFLPSARQPQFFPQKEKSWHSLHMLVQQSFFCNTVFSCKISRHTSLLFLCKYSQWKMKGNTDGCRETLLWTPLPTDSESQVQDNDSWGLHYLRNRGFSTTVLPDLCSHGRFLAFPILCLVEVFTIIIRWNWNESFHRKGIERRRQFYMSI